jgi:outer membrane lipoprotein-sorting protein
MLLLVFAVVSVCAQDAREHLKRTAQTYKQLRSIKLESEAEQTNGTGSRKLTAILTLYASLPYKARVDTKDSLSTVRGILISNGKSVVEYRVRQKEYSVLPGRGLSLSFSPQRGVGWGEMLYDTIAEGIKEATVRGNQLVQVGNDQIPCVVVDADYGELTKYTFWIASDTGLVLRRLVTIWNGAHTKSILSTVRALTLNEPIPDNVFEFEPPDDAKQVPL